MASAMDLGRVLLLGGLCASAALTGCGGGSTGPVGPVGPPGPVPPIVVGENDPLPGVNVVVTSVSGGSGPGGSFHSGDFVTVRFTVRTNLGFDLDVPSMEYGDAYLSGPSFNYQRVLAGDADLPSAAAYVGAGVWSYTFPTPIPAFYLPPFNDSASFGAGDGELAGQPLLDGTYTVGLELHRTYAVSSVDYPDAGVATADFLFGAALSIEHREVVANANCSACHTELRAHEGTRKDVRLCVLCHTSGAEDDNTAGATPGVSMDFRVMVHRIHDGSHLPSVLGVSTAADGSRLYPGMLGAAAPEPLEYQGEPGELLDFSEVNFPVWPNLNVQMPKDAGYSSLSTTDPDGAGPLVAPRTADDTIRMGVTACAKCHGDPDGPGGSGAPAQGDLFKLQPSRRACGSCHDDVDFSKPYTSNLSTMPPQPDDSGCAVCHTEIGSLPIEQVHLHPLKNSTLNPGVNAAITAVTGGTGPGGNFQVGDKPTVTFTLKDDTGANIGVSTMDSGSAFFLGPTTNRQLIMPLTAPNGQTVSPYDFAGRLHTTSSTGKGSMSKLFLTGPAATETLIVEFTSATTFSVTGTVSGLLGTGTLPASTSSDQPPSSIHPNPTITGFDLGAGLAAGGYTVVFSTSTAFVVSGPSGTIGSGVLPAAINASMRFTSPGLSFILTQGSTAMSVFPHTINFAVFAATGPVNLKFAVVAGRTAFASAAPARDRFYYEVVPNAPTYTLKIPMDMVLEFVGVGSGLAGQTLTPGNTPATYGRQQLWEAVPTVPAVTTTTLAFLAAMDRRVDVPPTVGFANGDTVVIEPLGVVGVREYVQIAPARADGVIAAATDTTTRLWFKTPLRYAHSLAVTVSKVTLTFKQEGATNAYTFPTSGTGLVTSVVAFTSGAGIVMSYRTDGRFGYYLDNTGTVASRVTKYVPPANDSTDIGQEQGDWHALPYQDGTYTADLWFARNLDLGLQNEVQTYRCTANSAQGDFLFGAAVSPVPHAIISADSTCLSCHDDLLFHGGTRRGLDTCLACHSVSGSEDKPRWDTPKVGTTTTDTALTPGVAIEFRQMLHKIHRGSGLAFAATYTVVGNGGSPSTYGEVEFPAMPGDVRQCVKCHGSDTWKVPAPRVHALATLPVRVWGDVCGSCHDSDAAHAHIDTNTVGGSETCDVCHGPGGVKAVEKVHLPR